MKRVLLIALVPLLAFSAGCTDAARGKISAFGGSAEVRCFSADSLIYSGRSTGKVQNSDSSDGYYFVDAADNKLKEVSGNCIVTYEDY